MTPDEELIAKQERQEENKQIAKELHAMISTPGWRHFKNHLDEKINESFSLRNVNIEGIDAEIANSVKSAKNRKDILTGLENWLKDKIKRGGISYG